MIASRSDRKGLREEGDCVVKGPRLCRPNPGTPFWGKYGKKGHWEFRVLAFSVVDRILR